MKGFLVSESDGPAQAAWLDGSCPNQIRKTVEHMDISSFDSYPISVLALLQIFVRHFGNCYSILENFYNIMNIFRNVYCCDLLFYCFTQPLLLWICVHWVCFWPKWIRNQRERKVYIYYIRKKGQAWFKTYSDCICHCNVIASYTYFYTLWSCFLYFVWNGVFVAATDWTEDEVQSPQRNWCCCS